MSVQTPVRRTAALLFLLQPLSKLCLSGFNFEVSFFAFFYPGPVPEFDLDSKDAGHQLHILILTVVSFSVIASSDVTPEMGDKGEMMEEQHSYVDNPLLTTIINKLHIMKKGLPSQ
jgi:hypothetical protein